MRGPTVFHEEVPGGVGISDGLSSPVQVHHVGTEEVHVALALAEQPLRASPLGEQTPRDKEVCGLSDTCALLREKTCCSETVF